jgi:hypothetical protein
VNREDNNSLCKNLKIDEYWLGDWFIFNTEICNLCSDYEEFKILSYDFNSFNDDKNKFIARYKFYSSSKSEFENSHSISNRKYIYAKKFGVSSLTLTFKQY